MTSAGVDVTDTFEIPEIAFTGDTTADFLNEPGKMLEDVLRARLLIIEVRGLCLLVHTQPPPTCVFMGTWAFVLYAECCIKALGLFRL